MSDLFRVSFYFLILLSLPVPGLAGQASPFQPFLIEDLLTSQARRSSVPEFVDEAARADLISIGETHANGEERLLLSEVYRKLFIQLAKKPECFVEDYSLLMPAEHDPVRSIFAPGCRTVKSVVGNAPSNTGFLADIQKPLQQKKLVLTHSGYRHILPLGIIYPLDFLPTLVDTKPGNTISSQLPAKFIAQERLMVSFGSVDYGQLITDLLVQRLLPAVGNQDPTALMTAIDQLDSDFKAVQTNSQLQMAAGENERIFLLPRMQSLTNPRRHSYLAVIKNDFVHLDLVKRMLASPQLFQFLKTRAIGTRLYGSIDSHPMGFAGRLQLEAGSVLVFGSGKGFVSIHPDGRIEAE